jgi:hypothetical protein
MTTAAIKNFKTDGYATLMPTTDRLPQNWALQIRRTCEFSARFVNSRGRGPGSLEPEETAGLDYRVLTGKQVKELLPWLWQWYQSPILRNLVGEHVGCAVNPSDDLESSINVNYVQGLGGRYEWHVDAQPYTAILYADTMRDSDGGGLMLAPGADPTAMPDVFEVVRPTRGLLLIFDGSSTPHAVEPLLVHTSRVSIPMIFLPEGVKAQRHEDLDAFIFQGDHD